VASRHPDDRTLVTTRTVILGEIASDTIVDLGAQEVWRWAIAVN
jgi:hypothetical protein